MFNNLAILLRALSTIIFDSLPKEGKLVSLHTYLSISENNHTLFAFSSLDEKSILSANSILASKDFIIIFAIAGSTSSIQASVTLFKFNLFILAQPFFITPRIEVTNLCRFVIWVYNRHLCYL